MSINIHLKSDGVLEQIAANLAAAPTWLPKIQRKAIKWIGPRAVKRMQEAVSPHRYTGALEDSIKAEYQDSGKTVVINPTAQRGRWDAGLILELGTKPIPRAPWAPIAAWASFRGLPAFPVVYKIRTRGVSAHPFLDETVSRVEPDLDEAVEKVLGWMVAAVLHGATE